MWKFIVYVGLLGFAPLAATESTPWLPRCEIAIARGKADDVLKAYCQIDKSNTTPEQRISVAINLGEAFFRAGQFEQANKILQKGYQQAEALKNPALIGEVQLRLGQVATADDDQVVEALKYFKQALVNAKLGKQPQLAAAVLLNQLKLQPQLELLQQAEHYIDILTDQALQNELRLSLAYEALQAGEFVTAERLLVSLREQVIEPRQRSQVLGYLGLLNEKRQQFEMALTLTEKAMLVDNAPELLMRWQWQRGRLLSALGRRDDAISAYSQAIEYLQLIKINLPVVFLQGVSLYKETYKPLYMALIEQLWLKSKENSSQSDDRLNEILKYWEELKAAELRDYFRQSCAVRQNNQKFKINEGTAVLYPIMLEKHLLLIVKFSDNTTKAFDVPAGYGDVERITQGIVNKLEQKEKAFTPHDINPKLYKWLLQPVQHELQARNIKTLLYLPDGPLRQIPLGVINDGQHYVAERYKVVLISALSLLSPPPQSPASNGHRVILAGMSILGPVVDELLSGTGDDKQRYLLREQLKDQLKLPFVAVELNALSCLLQTNALENKAFTLEALEKKITEGVSIIHLATHGYFSGDFKGSYVMTHDHLLTMNKLAEIFQSEALLKTPVDLLTLSACETAKGDDRSPLGLSGIVVQMGVRSAIGTLWKVGDKAAQEFFTVFYREYWGNGASKIDAFQIAQQHLMRNECCTHPFLWAAFVLIGDWQ